MNDEFFRTCQRPLLAAVNTSLGRYFLGIKHTKEATLLTPSAIHFYLGNNRYEAWCYTHPYFAKKLSLLIKTSAFLTLLPTKGASGLILPMLLTDTFSPITGGHGRLLKNDGGSWATNHDAASASNEDTIGNISARPAGGSHEISRYFNPHDTSSILTPWEIVSAFVRLIADGGTFDNVDSDSAYLVTNSQASTTALELADYDQLGTTQFGQLAFSAWNNTDLANNDITITDLTQITKAGTTKLGLRTQRDNDNLAPSGENRISWTSSTMVLSITYNPSTNYIGGKYW